MSILVLADCLETNVSPATHAAVTAATQLGGDIHLLVAASGAEKIASEAKSIKGIAKVLLVDSGSHAPTAEQLAPRLAELASGYTHVVAPATSFGRDVLPRAAALLDVAQVSDVVKILSSDTFQRPIYAGAAVQTVQALDACKFLTIRVSAFARAEAGGNAAAETLPPLAESTASRIMALEKSDSSRPDLSSARVVIAGGRGLGSKENFALLERIADKLNAALGASRAAVDAGYAPNDWQIGQTGKIVAPELYIAVGISGAIQHLAGMKESKVIVAINRDENAPIFEIADYALVADLFTVLPELDAALG